VRKGPFHPDAPASSTVRRPAIMPAPVPVHPAPSTPSRLAYLDNLKVGLIAGIIAAHAFNSYSDFGSWAYQDVQEVAVSRATETIFTIVTSFAGLFLMGLFFLISGLLTPPSIERKGVRRFVNDRLLRLGVPFAAFTLLLWPLTVYLVREPIQHLGSYWWWFTTGLEPFLDNGPMWFIGILLVYSLGYAAWWAIRSRRPASDRVAAEGPLRARTLLGLGAVIAVTSFLVRLGFPANSPQVLNLHLWEWPQCLGMFLFGTVCARRGWLVPVPDRIRRRCGGVSLIAGISIAAMILTADALGLDENDYFGGFGWPSLATSIAVGALVVAACIWVLGSAQRRLDRQGRLGRALARSAYSAFLLQGPVLIGFAFAMRPLDLPAELKALVLAVTGVTAAFALAWPIVTRTPLRRIL
jgi:hypothetical protein